VAKGERGLRARKVETGFRQATGRDRFGLGEGEKVVTSGNFLLDSESGCGRPGPRRRRRGEAHAHGRGSTPTPRPRCATATEKDPICGMTVDTAEAKAAGRTSTYEGRTYYFCALGCKETFDKDPAAHAKPRT
jgi:YHS domain-containing protein